MSSQVPYAEPLTAPFDTGGGWQDVITIPQPAAGGQLIYQTPGEFIERPRGMTFQVTTDATVGNRYVLVRIEDGNGGVYLREGAGVAIPASVVVAVGINAGRSAGESTGGLSLFCRMPDVFMQPGHLMRVTLQGVQAGDQFSIARMLVERFSTDPAKRRSRSRVHFDGAS